MTSADTALAADHQNMANAIRFLSADAVQQAKSGHPGMPMGMADVATVLFSRFLKFDASAPDWADRDRFVLSAGHGSMLLYSALYLSGYPGMTIDEIRNFRQLGSKTAGHPEYGLAPGIETTTGPLGQGLTTAVGMALAERMANARYGDDLVDHHTYVIAGDGCLMEGISHEAISMAGHWALGKLVVFWDDNSITIDGATDLSVGDNQQMRFEACGWHVQSVDGHDADAIAKAIEAAKASDKPSMIACKTLIGRGAPNKEGKSAAHGAPLGDDEIAAAREAMNWPCESFEVPEDTLSTWRRAGTRGQTDRAAWNDRLAASPEGERFTFEMSGQLPGGWEDALNAHKARVSEEKPSWATRVASGETLGALSPVLPMLIGGSADLTGSVNTKAPEMTPISRTNFAGDYIHYGIREHGMAAVMNGMALHGGFVPYAGTFLVFADYMKHAMRLSALMSQRVDYVLTHDSIGLGEDGPTHQAVETLASLRAIPNFQVFRPCDGVETAECWALALKSTETPSGMVLTRQGLPTQRVDHTEDNLCARGGYVLAEANGGSDARVATIMATGSEVSIAMAARDILEEGGTPTAVVSMPCWELFDAQSDDYRSSVLGTPEARVAVEAALRQGWEKYTGADGGFVGMTGFGASAPAGELYKHFGITPEAVVMAVRDRL
ncbi:MAG: transketolase [Rhodospirillales bacterium]|nr:transketolase [Rhodospirillales bacterium]